MIDNINIVVDFSFLLYYPTWSFWKVWLTVGLLTVPLSVYRTFQCDKEYMIPLWRFKWLIMVNCFATIVFPLLTLLVCNAIYKSKWQLKRNGWKYTNKLEIGYYDK